jgi:hypothetical protein
MAAGASKKFCQSALIQGKITWIVSGLRLYIQRTAEDGRNGWRPANSFPALSCARQPSSYIRHILRLCVAIPI